LLAVQVELAALEYRSSRLVRVLDAATGQRMGFGEGGATEVVSARYHPLHCLKFACNVGSWLVYCHIPQTSALLCIP